MTWLIAGLGQPGPAIREDSPQPRLSCSWTSSRLGRARGSRKHDSSRRTSPRCPSPGERVLLAKAHAFMNESGPAFASLVRKHRVDPDHVIAVHDEIDLAVRGAPREVRRLDGRSQRCAFARRVAAHTRVLPSPARGRAPARAARIPPTGSSRTSRSARSPTWRCSSTTAADAALSLVRDGLDSRRPVSTAPVPGPRLYPSSGQPPPQSG